MEFLDLKTGWTILHLIGVALGAGGAYASDWMFLTSVRDNCICDVENRFLKYGSRMVWIGLAILLISGTGLFMFNPEGYLASSKFLAKMSIILIITINGVIFHYFHIPCFDRHENKKMSKSKEFVSRQPLLIASGVISIVSWTFALILGSLKSVPYSFAEIMYFYLVVVSLGTMVGLIAKRHIFPKKR